MKLKGRDLASILDRETERTRELRPAIVLGCEGTQLHRIIVKGTSTPILVTSLQGRKTWPPGAEVMVGSYGGKSAPVIMGDPPAGHRGGAKFAPRTYPAGPPPQEANVCPVAITGKSYLAIFRSGNVLTACRYADGDFAEELASLDFSSPLAPPASGGLYQRVHALGDVIIFRGRRSARNYLVSWDVGASEAHALDIDEIPSVSDPVWPNAGTDIYFQSGGVARLQLYKSPIGSDGTIDEPSARVGAEFTEGTGNLAVPSILCTAGPDDFQVPCFWLEDDTPRVPYFSGAAWSLGDGRDLTSISPPTNGFACLGNTHSARATFVNGDFELPNIGLLPTAPGSPEVLLLPADWDLDAWLSHSISPDGLQLAIYGFHLGGETPEAGTEWLFRSALQGQTYPEGCPIPRIVVHERPGVGLPGQMLARD